MITRTSLRAIALATTCLAPLAAFADDFSLSPEPAPVVEAAVPPPGTLQFGGFVGLGLITALAVFSFP